MSSILDTPEQIEKYRLLAIRSALGLEMKGLKFRTSANKTACRMLGLRIGTSRAVTFATLTKYIENM